LLAWAPSIGFSSSFTLDDFSLIKPAYAGAVGNTLSGFVIDKNLVLPISGAKVEIPALSIATTTDLLGFYRFDGLPLGPTTLFVSADGYVSKTEPPLDITEQWTKHDIELVGGGPGGTVIVLPEIFGTVYDINTGTRIPGATITVTGPTAVAQLTTSAQSNVDLGGDYRTGKLDSGSYDVTASITGYQPKMETVSVASGTPASLDDAIANFYLKSFPYTVKGKVSGLQGGDSLDTLMPLENVEVQAILKIGNENEVYKRVLTDENGDYMFDDLPFGEWEFKAIPAVYDSISITDNLLLSTTDPPPDVIHNFDFLDRATVEVTVTSLAYGGMPISGIPVQLRNLEGIVNFGTAILKTSNTDSNGKVKFEFLPTGTYEVFVKEAHFKGSLFYPKTKIANDVFATKNNPTSTVAIHLEPQKLTLSGTVTEKDGLLDRGINEVRKGERINAPIVTNLDRLTDAGLSKFRPCLGGGFEYIGPPFIFGDDAPDCIRNVEHDGKGLFRFSESDGAKIEIIKHVFNGQVIDINLLSKKETTSISNGLYFLDNLPTGKYTVKITKPGFFTKTDDVEIRSILPPLTPIQLNGFTFCQQNPLDPQCTPFCRSNPNEPVCDPFYCIDNPSDPVCDATYCGDNPAEPLCIDACRGVTSPFCKANFCDFNPNSPLCDPTDPCSTNPDDPACDPMYCHYQPINKPECGTSFCVSHPTHVTCICDETSVDPVCVADYCENNPIDTQCNAVCDFSPNSFECNPNYCADNPDNSVCDISCATDPDKPSCTNTSFCIFNFGNADCDENFCTKNPNAPVCSQFCADNPDNIRCDPNDKRDFTKPFNAEYDIKLLPLTEDVFVSIRGVLYKNFDDSREKRVPLDGATVTITKDGVNFEATTDSLGFAVIKDVPLDFNQNKFDLTGIRDATGTPIQVTIKRQFYNDIGPFDATLFSGRTTQQIELTNFKFITEEPGAVYFKELMTLKQFATINISEILESYFLNSEGMLELSFSGKSFSNPSRNLPNHLYESSTGFSSQHMNQVPGVFLEKTNGDAHFGLPGNGRFPSALISPDSTVQYSIDVRPGTHEMILGGSIREQGETVPMFRISFTDLQPGETRDVLLKKRDNTLGLGVRTSELTVLTTPPNTQISDILSQTEAQYNLHGQVFDAFSGRPVPDIVVLLKMESPGKNINPFATPNFVNQATIFIPGGTTPVNTDVQGKFLLEKNIPLDTYIFKVGDTPIPATYPWETITLSLSGQGYDDLEVINGLHQFDFSEGVVLCFTPGNPPEVVCPTDFIYRTIQFMTPRGEMSAHVRSAGEGAMPPEVMQIPGTPPNPDDKKVIPATLLINKVKLPDNTDQDIGLEISDSDGRIDSSTLSKGQYNITIKADKHYSIKNKIVPVEDMLVQTYFELEPIPDPTVVDNTFFIYYPSGAGDEPPIAEDHKRKLTGYVIKGFKSTLTDKAKARVIIDRGELRPSFEDPVTKVDLIVKPKLNSICVGDLQALGMGKSIDDLTVVFPGKYVPNVNLLKNDGTPLQPAETSKNNKKSLWTFDQVDPEFDLPCGELEFSFEIHTPAIGLTEEGPIDYGLFPSYATTVLNLILTLGSYVDGKKPDFLKTIDKPFKGLKYATGLGEFEFGALKIVVVDSEGQKTLNYEMDNLSFKTDFGVGKVLDPILGLVSGLIKITPPTVFAKFENPKFTGKDGVYNAKATAGVEAEVKVSLDDKKALKAEKKVLEKLKKKLGKKFGKKIGGVKLSGKLEYTQDYVRVKGVDNPVWTPPTGGSQIGIQGITEETTFEVTYGITTPEIDIGVGFVSAFAGPGAPAVYAVLKALDINILSIQLGNDVVPKFVQKMKLENFDPLGYPIRVVEVDKDGNPILNEKTFGHANVLKLTFKYLLALTSEFSGKIENLITFSQSPNPKNGPFGFKEVKIDLEGTMVNKFKLPMYPEISKEYKTKKVTIFKRSWATESEAFQTKINAGPTNIYQLPSSNNIQLDPGDIFLDSPSPQDPVKLGVLWQSAHPSPTLSIDSNDNGNSMVGYVQQDPERTLPNNLLAKDMILDDNNFVWSDEKEIHEQRDLPDIAGAEVVYFENGKVIAVWSTIDDSINKNFELIQHLNEADVEYAVYDALTDTWSPSMKLTDDNFIDTSPVADIDETTDKVMAVWAKDRDGYLLTTGEIDLYYSIWDSSTWTVPAILLANSQAIALDVAYHNGKAAVSYQHQTGPRDSAVSLIQFENNIWGMPQPVSDGTNGANPGVVINNNEGFVVWSDKTSNEVFENIFYSTFTNPVGPKQTVNASKYLNVIEGSVT